MVDVQHDFLWFFSFDFISFVLHCFPIDDAFPRVSACNDRSAGPQQHAMLVDCLAWCACLNAEHMLDGIGSNMGTNYAWVWLEFPYRVYDHLMLERFIWSPVSTRLGFPFVGLKDGERLRCYWVHLAGCWLLRVCLREDWMDRTYI